ncbi:glycosyltransferase family 2 protein [Prevotella denticola]|uniref:glycosyltransferase family 2 protein n=1 Tax=Prevotella denticola TaxID=28129 RepID=UPI001C5D59EE|nr:glycosyltransferase family 2 protein [Prevotella denticola]MBW4760292.1 glycosyltransferase [Prevotella denticola]
MRCAISVIVPIYKAEDYLHKCIDGILSQTFNNFQLILVDDGSPDNSGKICDDYATNDSRIEVIHKKNGGLTSARKCGVSRLSAAAENTADNCLQDCGNYIGTSVSGF